jgi:hypothetical protein
LCGAKSGGLNDRLVVEGEHFEAGAADMSRHPLVSSSLVDFVLPIEEERLAVVLSSDFEEDAGYLCKEVGLEYQQRHADQLQATREVFEIAQEEIDLGSSPVVLEPLLGTADKHRHGAVVPRGDRCGQGRIVGQTQIRPKPHE